MSGLNGKPFWNLDVKSMWLGWFSAMFGFALVVFVIIPLIEIICAGR
jgi:hypothetical protein